MSESRLQVAGYKLQVLARLATLIDGQNLLNRGGAENAEKFLRENSAPSALSAVRKKS